MPCILSKIIPSQALASEGIFMLKSKAEFVLTNLKTFGPLSFTIIKNKML